MFAGTWSSRIIGVLVAVVLLLGVTATVIVLTGRHRPGIADPPRAAATTADSPAPGPSLSPVPAGPPAPSRSAAPSSAAATTAAGRKSPPPSPNKVRVVAPPPPARPGGPPPTSPPPGAACPTYAGPVAPRAEVAAAMGAAAGRAYRPTLSLDDTSPPPINVRLQLLQGIGWQESGWQSTIVACDGGTGTMQVMRDTADWMNLKYGTSYDYRRLDGNTSVAAGYLAWLTRYFGDRYFNGDYNLSGDPNRLVLLDMVISAYQAGFGAVDNALAKPEHTLPNTWYVYAVEGFMTSRPWEAA